MSATHKLCMRIHESIHEVSMVRYYSVVHHFNYGQPALSTGLSLVVAQQNGLSTNTPPASRNTTLCLKSLQRSATNPHPEFDRGSRNFSAALLEKGIVSCYHPH